MSLRSLLSGSAIALLVLALMAATALVLITSRMGTNTSLLWHSLESVQTAGEIELALLRHNRDRRLFGFTGKEHYATLMKEEERKLEGLLREADSLTRSDEEKAVVEDLAKHTAEYLELTAQLMTQDRKSLEGNPQLVDLALPTAQHLVDINRADAEKAWMETDTWDGRANTLGGLVAGLLLAGILLNVWLIRRDVYQPLLAIQRALVRFSPGNAHVVAPEAGARELREIAHEFNRMAERLERQREVQLRFIAGVAHDLRNPLSALKLSAAAVRPDRPLPSEEKVRERFEVVLRQVARLERMVEDLLDTARIEAGQLRLQLEVHDLVGLVREAVTLHEGVSALHPLVLQPPAEVPLPVRCDGTRIVQVLNNLLSNAIKYSPAGGPVRVELTSTPEAIWVAVEDSGVGIPAEELESIFEPFKRSSTTQGTIPGVGLGLAVARRIIDAHGGHIEVRSQLGAGTTFRFTLPREPRL